MNFRQVKSWQWALLVLALLVALDWAIRRPDGRTRALNEAIQAAAKQFESLFLNQLLKSMRDAQKGDGEGLFDSNESRMYTGLLDEQLANRIANGPGIGMADMVISQIDRSRAMARAAEQAAGAAPAVGEVKNGQAMPIIRQGDRNVR